jgi:hypothetical protein
MRLIRLVAASCIPFVAGLAQSATRMPPIGIDSLVTQFNGLPTGMRVFSLFPMGNGYRYTEYNTFPGVTTMTVNVDLDSSLAVLHATANGVSAGRRFATDVVYRGQRALGQVRPIKGDTPYDVPVDTVLPPGAFDALAAYPVLLSREWKVGQTGTYSWFDTDAMEVSTHTVRILGVETLRLPGGPQRALRAQISEPPDPLTIWFTEARPHRLLKIVTNKSESVRIR